jgi:hypothetical protein
MNVTIYIPTEILTHIENTFSEKFGGKMTQEQLVEFLKQDVTSIYIGEFLSDKAGLYDALDMFVAD